ncbi:sucrase ferredoxin [Pseudonocardia sp. McavD-2-B]|uniref:sucrase ferredoxin n=1 Tax=Pseudonocardia sp. McavD-2-B TaxID=2954499 RepID=UPI002096D966|nr:sucrase ferredoxin [Pseudonocardia sp. McavD-2-B]MCO7196686.1 sucrase ferredoxin [Pseudonocardia sp. McavD-2-B]
MTAAREYQHCAELAGTAGDPAEGTAPPARRWFLVEHLGPWPRQALAGLDPAAASALGAWAGEEGARVVLVRRPGRRDRDAVAPGRRWFRVDARPGHEDVRTGIWSSPAELAAAVHADGDPHPDPLVLVCAHGRHDACCAVRGRPLAAALVADDPEGTWECSHIGGCRFAPALVLLPHGLTYGGVTPADGPAVVREYGRGLVVPGLLRGRSALPPAVQAAQHHARAVTGATGVDDLGVADVDSDGRPPGHTSWRVTFHHPDCVVEVRERFVEVDRPLTCAARPAGRIRVFDLVDTRT